MAALVRFTPTLVNFNLSFNDVHVVGATGLELRFWRSANIEPIVSSDKLHLELVTDGATQVLWDKNDDGGPGLGWKQEVIDVQALVTGPFQLRFVFDSVDDVNNSQLGVLVDDVELVQDCGGSIPCGGYIDEDYFFREVGYEQIFAAAVEP